MKRNLMMRRVWLMLILLAGFSVAYAGERDTYVKGKNSLNTWSPQKQKELPKVYVDEEDIQSNTFNSELTAEPEELSLPAYQPWESVALQGKLKMDGLPLSPSVKIFMAKDSLIDISIRAPFVGEAGRLQMTRDSVLVVNNMKKVYVKEPLVSYSRDMEGMGIGDVQNLLLRRLFLSGLDWNTEVSADMLDIIDDAEGGFLIVPSEGNGLPYMKYGFGAAPDFTPLNVMLLPGDRPDTEIDVNYTSKGDGYDVTFIYRDSRMALSATLELKAPEYGGEAPKAQDLGKKYRQVSLPEFLRSF